ncbi:MAG: hypothetical protein RIQ46_1710 [Pseudomonadota bacterium]|jgi:signal transduction histidine kinase
MITLARQPRVPARVVIASIAGVWLCYFVLATLRAAIVGFEFTLPMLSRRLVVTVAAMGFTAMIWPILRLLDGRDLWVKGAAVLLAALPASLAIAVTNQWVFSDIESEVYARIGEKQGISIRRDEAGNVLVDVPDEIAGTAEAEAASGAIPLSDILSDDNRLRQISDLALGRYFVLLAWAALYLALANAEQARLAERRAGEHARAAKAAELRSLRYQVNPHFLFNTLNSLSALVMTGKNDRAERMIQTLATFYRRGLSEDPTADHPLAEEIELQKLYLEIEAVRFPDRLRTNLAIPAGLAQVMVPGMILQPLVENSVKYAVAASRDPVTITVSAREDGGMVEVVVSDDGPGISHAGTNGFGIGLSNVRDRLAARFGAEASVDSGPAGGGYRTVIRLPKVASHG